MTSTSLSGDWVTILAAFSNAHFAWSNNQVSASSWFDWRPGISLHVTVLMLKAFPPSLNPAPMWIFLFSGSFSCFIWQGAKYIRNPKDLSCFCSCWYTYPTALVVVVLLQIFTSRAVDAPRLEHSLFLIDVSQYRSSMRWTSLQFCCERVCVIVL